MALFRDCLRMSTVADTGDEEVVAAILSISAVPVLRRPRNKGARLIRLPDSQEIAAGTTGLHVGHDFLPCPRIIPRGADI